MSQGMLQATSTIRRPVYTVQSDKDLHFVAPFNIGQLRTASLGPLQDKSCVIRGIAGIQNIQGGTQLPYWVMFFWRNNGFQNPDYDQDAYEGHIFLSSTSAPAQNRFVIAGALPNNLYQHTQVGINPDHGRLFVPIPYKTDDGFFHVGIMPVFANFQAGSQISFRFFIEPVGDAE